LFVRESALKPEILAIATDSGFFIVRFSLCLSLDIRYANG